MANGGLLVPEVCAACACFAEHGPPIDGSQSLGVEQSINVSFIRDASANLTLREGKTGRLVSLARTSKSQTVSSPR